MLRTYFFDAKADEDRDAQIKGYDDPIKGPELGLTHRLRKGFFHDQGRF